MNINTLFVIQGYKDTICKNWNSGLENLSVKYHIDQFSMLCDIVVKNNVQIDTCCCDKVNIFYFESFKTRQIRPKNIL